MDFNALADTMLAAHQETPRELPVLELRRAPVDELQRRARKLLERSEEACKCTFDTGQMEVQDDHTLIRLPQGARAAIWHASGAFKLKSGLGPMDSLFKEIEPKERLQSRTEELAASFGARDLLGRGEALVFERLWQIKAAGEDKQGRKVEPVICRAVGAFRHQIDGVPVLGPASVAVQLAGDGQMDMISTLLRMPSGDTLERAKVIEPERAVRQMVAQLAQRFPDGKQPREVKLQGGLRFGYFSFGKRKAQRLLAPVYAAVLDVRHEQESQGIVIVVAATERQYLHLDPPGQENPTATGLKANGRTCH